AARRRHRLGSAGLCLPGDRLVLGREGPSPRLSDGAAGAVLVGHDAVRARPVALLAHQAAREFFGDHELRDLPDVFRVARALPALAHPGGKPAPLQDLPPQPLHLCGRADPLRLLRAGRVAVARDRGGADGVVPRRGGPCLFADARAGEPQAGYGRKWLMMYRPIAALMLMTALASPAL